MKERVLSGMRPTGALHLGHYHGALKNWVRLQHDYDCFYFVADWHALTTDYENPAQLQKHVHEMVVDWLAAEMLQYGVKPEVEAFDLSHILKAKEMQQKGQLAGTPYVQFVMGVKNAMPADRDVFDYYSHTVERLFGKDAPWCAAGIGPAHRHDGGRI